MTNIKLDSEKFNKRLENIRRSVPTPLMITLGSFLDLETINLNSAVCTYLFGYEFPNTIIVIDNAVKVFSSKKKIELLQNLPKVECFVLNKDFSNIDEVKIALGKYNRLYVIDKDVNKGDFCNSILYDLRVDDVTDDVKSMFLKKDYDELKSSKKSGEVVAYIIKNSIEMLKDCVLDHSKIETMLDKSIPNVDSGCIEFSFLPIITKNSLRVGIRYNGYCSEAARTVFTDMNILYNAQKYILGCIKENCSSSYVYNKSMEYFKNNDLNISSDFLYTIGLLSEEKSFKDEFVIQRGIVFVIKLQTDDMILSNTFILEDSPVFITPDDKYEDFLDNRPRFRDRSKEHELDIRRREHQKELLEALIEERLTFYRNKEKLDLNDKNIKKCRTYSKESLVPRKGKIVVDYQSCAVNIPISEYTVPFHVSLVKNCVLVDDKVLKFNFNIETKATKPVKPITHEDKGLINSDKISFIKCINIAQPNAKEVYEQIQDLKNKYSVSEDKEFVKQDKLIEKQRKYALENVLVKTDVKTALRKKKGSNLELHENGFRYVEDKIEILFNNIRHVFYLPGDIQNRTLLHFNLYSPILVNNKKTKNVQFYQEAGINLTYNTSKRGDEQMEYIIEKEEEDRQKNINREFESFISRMENDTPLKVQVPKRGFTGVPFKESVHIQQTHECLVSLYEQPFYVVSLKDIEVVNFERVVFNVKTSDIVFIFKDKSIPPSKILSIESSNMNKIKEYLDSNGIVYLETVFNIQWKAVLKKILEDPISFYESGGWAELLVEEKESEEESEASDVEESSSDEDVITDDSILSSDKSEDTSFDDEDSDDSSDDFSEDEEDDTEEESSSDEKYKKRKRR